MKIHWTDFIIAVGLTVCMLFFYVQTLAPTIVAEGDGAEFAACVKVMGIPHKPGYPTYILMAKLFSLLPLGNSLIWKMNLLSALCAAGTLGLLFIIMRVLGATGLSAACAALLFGAGSEYWSQSIIAEVYTPLTFWLAACILLLLLWKVTEKSAFLLLCALWLGLGYGIHKTLLIITPLLLVYPLIKNRKLFFNFRLQAVFIMLLLAGACTYAYLPVQAKKNPLINIENPDSLQKTLRQLQFSPVPALAGQPSAHADSAGFVERIRSFTGYWNVQYPLAATLMGIAGLLMSLRAKELRVEHALLLAIALVSSIGFLFRYQFDPAGSRAYEYRVMYIPAYMIFSIWIARGIDCLCSIAENNRIGHACNKLLHRKMSTGRLIKVLTLAVLFYYCAQQMAKVDRSKNYFFYDFGLNLFDSAAQNAAILTTGDNTCYPLIYLQLVEGMRQDAAVVHLPIMNKDWYRGMLKHNYPTLKLPQGDMTVEEFVALNMADRDIYACYPFMINNRNSSFALQPAGLLLKFAKKNSSTAPPALFRPAHQRGVFDSSIPRDLREMSILTFYPLAHLQAGNACFRQQRYPESLREFQRGLDYPPCPIPVNRQVRATLYLGIGAAFYEARDFKASQNAWLKVLELDPNNTQAKAYLQRVQDKIRLSH